MVVAYGRGKTMTNSTISIPKVVAVAYKSGRLRESFFTEFICETKLDRLREMVAYESGRSKRVNCIKVLYEKIY